MHKEGVTLGKIAMKSHYPKKMLNGFLLPKISCLSTILKRRSLDSTPLSGMTGNLVSANGLQSNDKRVIAEYQANDLPEPIVGR